MSPEEAMQRLNVVLAHAWMVRAFLKHADEVQENEEMMEVHRVTYDFIRAVEPAWQRQDATEYLHRLRGKLPKLKKVAEYFAAEYRNVSDHTNFEMAARSLSGCVRQIEEILAQTGGSDPSGCG
jgi:hypothetical protein